MEKVAAAIAQFLEGAIAEGFQLPFYMAAVAVNGSVTVARYTPTNGRDAEEGLDAKFLAQHIEGRGFALLVNVMLTDSTGQAALMLIEKPETEPEFFWPHSLPDSTSH